MGLFKPIWMKDYNELIKDPAKKAKAIAYVNAVRNPDRLFRIAEEAPHHEIKAAAEAKAVEYVNTLRDPSRVFQIAKEAPTVSIRLAAVRLIDDPEKLNEMALDRHTPEEIAEAVINRVQDEDVLEAVSLSADRTSTRCCAIAKIRDQERLVRVAMNSYDDRAADCAAAHITDPGILLNLAMSETRHAEAAAKRINDDAALKNVALNAPLCTARRAALLQIDDVPTLVEALRKEDDEWNRREAFKKINWLVSSQDRHLTEDRFEYLVEYLKQYPDERESLRLESKKPGFPHELFDKVFSAAVEADTRGTSFLQTVWQVPEEQLPDMWLEAAERSRNARGGLEKPWTRARDEIKKRIELSDNPSVQMAVIRNAAFGKEPALHAIQRQFDKRIDDAEGIAALREEAINAYVDHIPSFPDKEGQSMFALTRVLPEEALEQYGFRISEHEQEDEDQFGRYTYDVTTIFFRGKHYWNNP